MNPNWSNTDQIISFLNKEDPHQVHLLRHGDRILMLADNCRSSPGSSRLVMDFPACLSHRLTNMVVAITGWLQEIRFGIQKTEQKAWIQRAMASVIILNGHMPFGRGAEPGIVTAHIGRHRHLHIHRDKIPTIIEIVQREIAVDVNRRLVDIQSRTKGEPV